MINGLTIYLIPDWDDNRVADLYRPPTRKRFIAFPNIPPRKEIRALLIGAILINDACSKQTVVVSSVDYVLEEAQALNLATERFEYHDEICS